jgi:hypothetical protein
MSPLSFWQGVHGEVLRDAGRRMTQLAETTLTSIPAIKASVAFACRGRGRGPPSLLMLIRATRSGP